MLVLRWCMTHNEPLSTITTSTSGEDQRQRVPAALGLRVHVQEVDHVHDDLHDGEGQQDQHQQRRGLAPTPPITSRRTGWPSG